MSLKCTTIKPKLLKPYMLCRSIDTPSLIAVREYNSPIGLHKVWRHGLYPTYKSQVQLVLARVRIKLEFFCIWFWQYLMTYIEWFLYELCVYTAARERELCFGTRSWHPTNISSIKMLLITNLHYRWFCQECTMTWPLVSVDLTPSKFLILRAFSKIMIVFLQFKWHWKL